MMGISNKHVTSLHCYYLFTIAVQFHYIASNFPNFDGLNAFFPLNSSGPWPQLQKGRNIPDMTC